MPRFSILSAFLCISVLISACGGSSGSNDDQPLTKAEFIKRADQICEQTDELQRDALKAFLAGQRGNKPAKALQEQIVVIVGLPPIRGEVQKLDALRPPEGDEEQVEAIVDGVEEAIAEGEEDPSTMVDPNSLGPFAKAGRLATEYGLKACAFPL